MAAKPYHPYVSRSRCPAPGGGIFVPKWDTSAHLSLGLGVDTHLYLLFYFPADRHLR